MLWQAGSSHFDTLHDSERLDWDGAVAESTVSTRPWLLLFEEKTLKGWVRSVPLTFTDAKPKLHTVKGRIQTFLKRFHKIAQGGDAAEQIRPDRRSEREARIAKAVQTALHWLAEAARSPEGEYQLMPVWTALEAVLGAIEYPKVFDNSSQHIKDIVLAAIDRIEERPGDAEVPRLSREMLRGRLLNNNWPVRTQVELFAKAFGIRLHKGDKKLVGRLAQARGKVVHTGDQAVEDLSCEISQLKYLVERLIMGASVGGIRAKKGDKKHVIKIKGIEPGTSGAASIYVNGREVSYTLSWTRRGDGSGGMVILADGQIYDTTNRYNCLDSLSGRALYS